jgi:hypothetical protein
VAEALIKHHGLHEGLWGIYVQFGLGAANVNSEDDLAVLTPAAIVPVRKLGLQRFAQANNLTVDAAAVNPATSKKSPKKGSK